MENKKKVIILDNSSNFIRNYIVNPTLNTNGAPIGGLIGSIKSLQKIVRDIQPDKIVIVWDGPGGSKKRKDIYKDYKSGRKPIRLNRFTDNLTDTELAENKIYQMTRLSEYYDNMPVHQLIYDSVEADDLIAVTTQIPCLKGWNKIIISSDLDFAQLLNDETILYRPIQDEILTYKTLIEEYGIHPCNFAVMKSIIGDKSDNIKGIKGIGEKTVAKCFPFLKEDREYLLDEIYEFCEKHKEEQRLYSLYIENFDMIKLNYRLVQLYVPTVSVQVYDNVIDVLCETLPKFNKTTFVKMLIQDGVQELNWTSITECFAKLGG